MICQEATPSQKGWRRHWRCWSPTRSTSSTCRTTATKQHKYTISYERVLPVMPTKIIWFFQNHYRPQTNLQEGNAFIPVCHSVDGMSGSVMTTKVPWNQIPREETPLEKNMGPDSKWHHTDPPGTTKVGGTHPTEMFSCFYWIHCQRYWAMKRVRSGDLFCSKPTSYHSTTKSVVTV